VIGWFQFADEHTVPDVNTAGLETLAANGTSWSRISKQPVSTFEENYIHATEHK